MRIATWNVNSLRARRERVIEWINESGVDVLCLQETKMTDEAYLALDLGQLGFESAHYGFGQWNGVAILSKVGLTDVQVNFAPGIEPDHESRIITATCGGIRVSSVYVPNGRALDHEHYQYKLGWLDRLVAHLEVDTSPDAPAIVAGDINIAPEDRDVFDPVAMMGSTHVSQPERDRVDQIEKWGMTDLFRHHHPEVSGVYSWWDYRNGDFHKGRGMRIDLIWGTRPVVEASQWCIIDRNARKGTQPSDHAPVVAEIAL
jgi:exodeoxyribonuclease-3